jgi:hypothetical protein
MAVANRLTEIASNPFKAAREADLPRTFVYEFLTGKKRSFRGESLAKFANALNWTVSELAAIVSENGEAETAPRDPVGRLSAEAAFSGLVMNLRPDLEEELPALVKLFRDLVLLPPEMNSSVPLDVQMFLRAQLPARRFAPK